jgi:hypothetical protein
MTSRCSRLASAALLAALLVPAVAEEVWKWTDAQGVTHYGPAPPDDARVRATRVDLGDTGVTDGDRRAAEWRLAKDKAAVDRATAEGAASRPARASRARQASAPASMSSSCEEAWKRFNDSYACFDPYRYGRGKIQPQAYQHCTEVQEPDASCR